MMAGGFPEPVRMSTPDEFRDFIKEGFTGHVNLIRALDGCSTEEAQWRAWIEGPIGRIHRIGQWEAKQQQLKKDGKK